MTCNLQAFYRKSHVSTRRVPLFFLSFLLSTFPWGLSPGWAQSENGDIIVDPNLGNEQLLMPDENQENRTNITGGAPRESNLFHSFEQFNILDSRRSVYFVVDESIENVLARVVGPDPSNILGTLGVEGGVEGGANLWLMNPNGIVFGDSAELDIEGSFYATTASAIPTGNGTFSALSTSGEQLLSMSPTASFENYLTADSGSIVSQGQLSMVNGSDRNVATEAVLNLSGSAIALQEKLDVNRELSLFAINDIETQGLRAVEGRLSLASDRGSIVVAGTVDVNGLDSADVGDVSIAAAGNIETQAIRARSLNIALMSDRGSITVTGTIDVKGIDGANAGDVSITAAGDIETNIIDANVSSETLDTAQGGTIAITTTGGGNILNRGRLNVGSVSGNRAGQESPLNAGSGGSITLIARAGGNIFNKGPLNTWSRAFNGNSNRGGDITMYVRGGDITNMGVLRSESRTDTGNAGAGGNINQSARGNGTITNRGALTVQSLANGNESGDAGTGGSIRITTENGDIINAPFDSTTDLNGNGGSLNTRSVTRNGNASDGGTIELRSEGGNIVLHAYVDTKSYSLTGGESENGGDILIIARNGSITGNAVNANQTDIITSTASRLVAEADESDAGSVSSSMDASNASDDEFCDNNRCSGNVRLVAGNRISGINVFTLSNRERSGDVTIRGTGNLQLDNVQIITNEDVLIGSFDFNEDPLFPANSLRGATGGNTTVTIITPQSGTPGNVRIGSEGDLTATNLLVTNNANSDVGVPAGNIRIASPTAITLIDSRLESDSVIVGDGGNIRIVKSETVILDNTELITRTAGQGGAGNITVDGFNYLLLRDGSLLLADAEENENGGRIGIGSSRVIAEPNGNNDIIANARGGDGGSIFSPDATLYGFELQDSSSSAQLRNRRSNDISARSESGQDGSIAFSSITETPNQTESEELDDSFSTSEQLISNSCIAPNSTVAGRFTIPGTGDLPPTPEDSTASVYNLGDVQTLPSAQISAPGSSLSSTQEPPPPAAVNTSRPKWELGDPIVEPESIARLADGRIAFGQSCGAL